MRERPVDIAISGHQVDMSEAFRTHAGDGINAIADKHHQRTIGANVTLGRGPRGSGFTCEIVMHVMADVILKGSGGAPTANRAFDIAAEKIEKQLRRYMRRLRARGSNGAAAPTALPALEASYRIFAPEPETEAEAPEEAHPVVIAEHAVDVPTASVADAVMMLDLRNTTALLFRNAGSGAFNMVYRRDDGAIGWVEPAGQRSG